MEQSNSEVIIIGFSTILILLITIGIVFLSSVFQKRKNELLEAQERAKKAFERVITEI
jgi:putative Mn2+ efflux pump MntP